MKTDQLFDRLTDGDLTREEYLSTLPISLNSLINSPTTEFRQCIKCDFTSNFRGKYCIIRNFSQETKIW